MSFVRVEKRKSPYVLLDKTCLNSTSLKWRSKGLLAYLLSLPDNWKINMTDLENRSSDGREGLRGAMAELIRDGYVERKRVKDEKGKMQGWEYVVYEVPKLQSSKQEQPELNLADKGDVLCIEPDEQSGPSVPARSNLFMRKYFGAWSRGTGGALLPAKWLREGLKALEDQHGESVVYDAFASFAASKDAKFGCKQFIQNFGQWTVKKPQVVVDKFGD